MLSNVSIFGNYDSQKIDNSVAARIISLSIFEFNINNFLSKDKSWQTQHKLANALVKTLNVANT